MWNNESQARPERRWPYSKPWPLRQGMTWEFMQMLRANARAGRQAERSERTITSGGKS